MNFNIKNRSVFLHSVCVYVLRVLKNQRLFLYAAYWFGFIVETLGVYCGVKQSSPVTGPEGPRGFQEVKVPRFRDNGTEWW